MSLGDERAQFSERLRVQFSARYPDLVVDADPDRFALRLSGPGLAELSLTLTPLFNQCLRQPSRTPRLIGDFVNASESRLVRRSPATLSLSRVLWCVRSRQYLDSYSAAGELLTVPVAGSLVAFASESLPNAVMRGVPRGEWTATHISDEQVRAAADTNTQGHFAAIVARIAAADRVPRDGWRLVGDPVFQSSLLTVPAALRALRERAGRDVLLAVPDRSMVLALPVPEPSDDTEVARFRQRVLRNFREAMHPLSRELLLTDGDSLRELSTSGRERLSLLDRLRA